MSTQPLTVTIENGNVCVNAPFNSDFTSRAKRLGGRWDSIARTWTFDARDEKRVRDLCFDIYGQDGIRSDLCTIEVVFEAGDSNCCGPLTVCGRTIARARGRDSGATLGEGVVCLKGGFSSGGSVKNWTTQTRNGATVLIRDFSRPAALGILEEGKTNPDQRWLTRIVDEDVPVVKGREALEAEKAVLLAHIAEIDQQLSAMAA